MSGDERAEFIAGLRAVADFYEQTPDFPLPWLNPTSTFSVDSFDPDDDDGSAALFAERVRLLGGERSKTFNDGYARVTRDFGGGVRVQVWAQREQVCTRTQVGTVTEQRPDPNAPMVEVEVPVYAWDCAPVLGDEREAAGS